MPDILVLSWCLTRTLAFAGSEWACFACLFLAGLSQDALGGRLLGGPGRVFMRMWTRGYPSPTGSIC
jgi:hypothetical protein